MRGARCPKCYAFLIHVVGWRGTKPVRVEVRCKAECGFVARGGVWAVGEA